MDYHLPKGLHIIPDHLLDRRPDTEVDTDLLNPCEIKDDKNIWFFWHQGFENMHPYTQRNVRAWHRRLAPQGWTIRVTNRVPGSALNIDQFLDTQDPSTFPEAFINGTIGGDYAPQHTSDLVRFPLLVKYGAVYADVGMIQIGDLERMWNCTVGDPASPYEVLSYSMGTAQDRALTNYFLCSARDNPFFSRCHQLLLKIWEGKTGTEGLHAHPLLRGLKLQGANAGFSFKEGSKIYTPDEVSKMLTDYIIQGQVMTMVLGLLDAETKWNGPQYCAEHVYAIDYMTGSQLINELTAWDGEEAFRLMSLPLPREGEEEGEDQRKARCIVERCLRESFGFKLAHGLILRVLGQTLGSLWRRHEGSDVVGGTYAAWFRHGVVYWNQDEVPGRQEWGVVAPVKVGPLLREV
ncbi:Glycosyltransferase afumC [Fulvia fulva]|uniref:Glycosyltransferase afumC n=1 Tax=Passalora fulva TaxID=5499 RepID=A0A9Q8LDC7_PASFU|nr:Glycosyltransferase afumC [Fulvia fulva]UJO14618.1 Glycosyltransferase afumC [Fulvia fulva]